MLKEKLTKEAPQKGASLSKEEEADASLATAMGAVVLATPEFQQGLSGMAQSADPVMVAGQVLAGLIMNLKEQAMQNSMDLSDKIWMAENGVADRLADDIIRALEATTGAELAGQEQKVWIEALNVMKMAAKAGSATPAGGMGAPPPQPAPPQGGMGPMGMMGGMA